MFNTDIPLKVIILLVILEIPLSVRGVGRRTQPISKLLNDLLITSALNPDLLITRIYIVSSQYMFSDVICFRIIHFILISTVHALFFTCLPVSISGT